MKPLWITAAGPYRSGAADADARAANLRALREAALAVFCRLYEIPEAG